MPDADRNNNDLEAIRALAAEPSSLADASRRAVLERLRREAARERRAQIVTAAPVLRAVAAVVAVAVVIGLAERADQVPGASAPRLPLAAAEPLLLQAAVTVRRQMPPAMPRGEQYLYERTTVVETPTSGRGPRSTFVDETWTSVDGSRPSISSELGRRWTTPPDDADRMRVTSSDPEELAAMPTEPEALRGAIVDAFGGPGRTPADTLETEHMGLLMFLAARRPAPPAVRAAAFRALAELPGVHVGREVDGLGRHGIGISLEPGYRRGLDWTVILDRESYEYLGMRSHRVRQDGTAVDQLITLTAHGVVDELEQRPAAGGSGAASDE